MIMPKLLSCLTSTWQVFVMARGAIFTVIAYYEKKDALVNVKSWVSLKRTTYGDMPISAMRSIVVIYAPSNRDCRV